MKRNLIVVAALGLALSANAVLADNNWAFDDAYWKNPAASGMATSLQASGNAVNAEFAKYIQVDGYNY